MDKVFMMDAAYSGLGDAMVTESVMHPNLAYLVFFMLLLPVSLWVMSNVFQLILPQEGVKAKRLPVNRLSLVAKTDSLIPGLPLVFVLGIGLVLLGIAAISILGM